MRVGNRTYNFLFLYYSILFLLFGCQYKSWHPAQQPLKSFQVNKLKLYEDYLYAATALGLFRKDLSTLEDSLWTNLGPNYHVKDFVTFNDEEFLVGIKTAGFESPETSLFKTTTEGFSWVPFQNGFGGKDHINWISNLTMHPNNRSILFATGGVNVIRSLKGGMDWKIVFSRWKSWGVSYFVKVDTNNPDIIWTGGQLGIIKPYLAKSTDRGNTWNFIIDGRDEYGSTGSEDLYIDPEDSSNLLLGMGIGVLRSTDGGDSWEPVFNQASIFAFAQSKKDKNLIYASGLNRNSSLFFSRTDDFGESWQMEEIKDFSSRLFTLDLITVDMGGEEILFLGTNKGVYRHSPKEY